MEGWERAGPGDGAASMLNIFNMRFFEIGPAVHKARISAHLTQLELARRAGLTRTTVNQVETGSCRDLGARKVIALLEALGLEMQVRAVEMPRRKDYLRMACRSANTSFRIAMTPDELARALLTGKVAPELRPHLRALFDEAPSVVLQGVLDQVVASTAWPERVAQNARSLAEQLGCRAIEAP